MAFKVLLVLFGAVAFAGAATLDSSCKCGQKTVGSRIVGGNEVQKYEYPWQVALEIDGFFCGGSLINNLYILTAAHCTQGKGKSDIKVILRDHDISSTSETNRIIRTVSAIKQHTGYNSNTMANDIALLKLSSPVPISANLLPVCLPVNIKSTYAGKTGTATGWGTTSEGGSQSDILKEVDVPILSNAQCTSDLASTITSGMICAGEAGKDACQGDSGGPLTVVDGGGNYDLVGVTSWGFGCGDAGNPGVYTRVTEYISWIGANTNDAVYCAGAPLPA